MLAKDLKVDQDQDATKRTNNTQKHILIGAIVVATSTIVIALLRGKRR
jgi:hypothetical protein